MAEDRAQNPQIPGRNPCPPDNRVPIQLNEL